MTNTVIFGCHFYGDNISKLELTDQAQFTGNVFALVKEDRDFWTIYTEDDVVVLSKSLWKCCIAGDHAILLLDLSKNLYYFKMEMTNNRNKIKCHSFPLTMLNRQEFLFTYECSFLAFTTNSTQDDTSELVLLHNATCDLSSKVELRIVAELTLPFHVMALSCGKEHVVILDAEGRVYTLGSNIRGQLGCGGTELKKANSPFRVDLNLLGLHISQIEAGGWHSVVVDGESNTAYSWGWNESGQLGRSPEDSILADVPSLIDLDDDAEEEAVIKVRCGSRHTSMMTKNCDVYTFGSNCFGQLCRATDGEFDWRPVRIAVNNDGESDGTRTISNIFAFAYATMIITTH